MSDTLQAFRNKYPVYNDIPDKDMVLKLGERFPAYLATDPGFKSEYDRADRGVQLRRQLEDGLKTQDPTTSGELGGVVKQSFSDFFQHYGEDVQSEMQAIKEMSANPPNLPKELFQPNPIWRAIAPSLTDAIAEKEADIVSGAISPESALIGTAALVAPGLTLGAMAMMGVKGASEAAGRGSVAAQQGDIPVVAAETIDLLANAGMVLPGLGVGAKALLERPTAPIQSKMFEPSSTLNTGTVQNERTVAQLDRI